MKYKNIIPEYQIFSVKLVNGLQKKFTCNGKFNYFANIMHEAVYDI